MTSEPLRRVYQFSVGFLDTFWANGVAARPEELVYIHEHGERLVSLTLERWRRHTVARSTVIPWSASPLRGRDSLRRERQPPMPERVMHLYSTGFNELLDYALLWELLLAPSGEDMLKPTARLQLRLDNSALRLCAIYDRFGYACLPDRDEPKEENILLHVPLDAKKLEPFKLPDDDESDDNLSSFTYKAEPWLTCYGDRDENAGIHWDLWIHDLGAASLDIGEPEFT